MWLKRWWRRNFSKDKLVVRNDEAVEAYVAAGTEFGDVVSYIYMGECIGFDKLLDQWERAERAYSALGYRTLSIDDFIGAGGWGRDISPLVRVPRKEGEPEVFHAAFYRKRFFQKFGPIIDFDKMMEDGQTQSATYAAPSTDHLKQA